MLWRPATLSLPSFSACPGTALRHPDGGPDSPWDPAGTRMATDHMDLLFTVIWSFALANILGAGLCLFLCKPLARLTTIRFAYLAPAFLITMIFGAYQSTKHLGDLAVMLGLGLLGWGMKRMGWPRPPFLIAFVLSVSTERYSGFLSTGTTGTGLRVPVSLSSWGSCRVLHLLDHDPKA